MYISTCTLWDSVHNTLGTVCMVHSTLDAPNSQAGNYSALVLLILHVQSNSDSNYLVYSVLWFNKYWFPCTALNTVKNPLLSRSAIAYQGGTYWFDSMHTVTNQMHAIMNTNRACFNFPFCESGAL